jgi:hypothetical protein
VADDTIGFTYRGKPIGSYALTAHKILIGKAPWHRLPVFIRSYVERVEEIKIHDNGRSYLQRKEFSLFSNNFNDYLRVACQLGLIEKRKGTGRQKEYYPTDYAVKVHAAKDYKEIQKILIESIFDIIRNARETVPDERHALFLLWLLLSLRDKGVNPTERHFAKAETELKTYVPLIRLNFAKSLCQFLFDNKREDEKKFYFDWNRIIGDSKNRNERKDDKNKLTLFDV